MVKRHPWRAGFRGMTGSRNFVSRLERISRETSSGHLVRVTQFGSPMLHITFVVRHIE